MRKRISTLIALICVAQVGTVLTVKAQYEGLEDLDFGSFLQGMDFSGFTRIQSWGGQNQEQINNLYALGWIDEEVRDRMHNSLRLLVMAYSDGGGGAGSDPDQMDFGYPDNWGPDDYDDSYWVDPPESGDYGPLMDTDGWITSEGARMAQDLWKWQQDMNSGVIEDVIVPAPQIPIDPNQMDLFGSGFGTGTAPAGMEGGIADLVNGLRWALSACDDKKS